jgi:hypothetical protein
MVPLLVIWIGLPHQHFCSTLAIQISYYIYNILTNDLDTNGAVYRQANLPSI